MNLSFLERFFPSNARPATLGLEVRPDGIAWALRTASGTWQAGFDDCVAARREATLRSRVQDLSPGKCRVRLVLPLDQYQVFSVERPPVEAAELAAAVRWKLKDLVDFSIEDAVVDVFDFPEDASRGHGDLVNAVITRRSLVRELALLLDAAGLELAEVDVAELALRNIPAMVEDTSPARALVYLRNRYGHMIVCQGSTLYLSRRLEVGNAQLEGASSQEQAVMSLGLEMQRSLDYYESQLRQVPPKQIQVTGHDASLPLTGLLAGTLAARVESLDLAPALQLPSLDPRVLYAIGAAQPVEGPGS